MINPATDQPGKKIALHAACQELIEPNDLISPETTEGGWFPVLTFEIHLPPLPTDQAYMPRKAGFPDIWR